MTTEAADSMPVHKVSRHSHLIPALLCIALFLTLLSASSGHVSSVHASAACGAKAPPPPYVNLQDFPLYLKRGFDPQDAVKPNPLDGSWLKKSPFSNVIISRLALPGLPRRVFLSPFAGAEEEFTFVIPFTLNGADRLASDVVPGLFLAGIGDNWEIYLNGTLIRREIHLDEGSLRILRHSSRRDVFFPLPVHMIREGDNLLAFRIVGDPTDQTVGFQYSAPFYIGDYKDIVRKNDETPAMILIGGYLLIAVYHLLLFAIRRTDAHNLYCGVFSALMGFYFLFRTHNIYHYIADTAIVVKLEFFCIFLVIPAMGAFVETLCGGKISRTTKLYSAVFAFLALSQLALPRPYGSDALVVWQFMGIAALLYILICNIIIVFIREVRAEKKQYALRGVQAPGITYFLTETYAGNLLLALSILVASAIVDILDSLLFHYKLNLTRYSFYFFTMTVTLMLARIYGKLNNALQAKRIFLANMSHEIRTPLNAIMGTAEQIARERPPEAILAQVERIKRAGGILTSIINDILDFSRLEAGKIDIVNREYRFRSLIDEVVSIISMRLADKDVKLVVHTDPAIPETLIGDALRIRQVLLNLLWNAVKFTSRGTIELRSMPHNDSQTMNLVFTVSDTGTGIKRHNLSSIFTEFYQLDSKVHQNAEGTGLGLSICKNLCLLMGGEISVRSKYGKGSVFTVTLPQKPGAGELAAEQARETTLFEQGIGFPDARALIVDDLESNRQVMLGLLSPYGMETHAAASGREALELAAGQAYDIIFMDHIMEEDMDGVAAVQDLRRLPGHARTPVVAMTANAITGMREFFLKHGFQDYISKPIDPHLLDAAIAAWLPLEKRAVRAARERKPESPPSAPIMPCAVHMELAFQRFDLLRHYHWHFTNHLPTDADYCRNFSVLLDALMAGLTPNAHAPAKMHEEAARLAEAGRRGDAEAIRQDLPALYKALAALCSHATTGAGAAEKDAARQETAAEPARAEQGGQMRSLRQTLHKLKDALEKGDEANAEALMARLRVLPSTASDLPTREGYFLIYDALMMGETEKALGVLALCLNILDTRTKEAG